MNLRKSSLKDSNICRDKVLKRIEILFMLLFVVMLSLGCNPKDKQAQEYLNNKCTVVRTDIKANKIKDLYDRILKRPNISDAEAQPWLVELENETVDMCSMSYSLATSSEFYKRFILDKRIKTGIYNIYLQTLLRGPTPDEYRKGKQVILSGKSWTLIVKDVIYSQEFQEYLTTY